MHATIHRFRQWPDEETRSSSLLDALIGGVDAAGACVLGRLDGMGGAVVTFWPDETGAEAAASRTAEGARLLDATVYEVAEHHTGPAAGNQPRFAQVVRLNGAGDARRADAAIRAGRERIAPAVGNVDGVVGTYVLRAGDHSMVVLTPVTDADIPERLGQAIMATELLPWEDPAELTGPDRIDVDRVLVSRLPSTAPAGTPS